MTARLLLFVGWRRTARRFLRRWDAFLAEHERLTTQPDLTGPTFPTTDDTSSPSTPRPAPVGVDRGVVWPAPFPTPGRSAGAAGSAASAPPGRTTHPLENRQRPPIDGPELRTRATGGRQQQQGG